MVTQGLMRQKDFKVLLIYPNTMMATLVPLHVSLLSACLKKKGFQVRLFDTTYYKTEKKSFEQRKVELLMIKKFSLHEAGISFKKTDIYDDLRALIKEYRPNLIGISFVEDTYPLGLSLLKSIKEFNIPVIAGGVFANFFADEMLKEKTIDMVCIGEGEEALVQLCEAVNSGTDYSKVKNIWVKRSDGTIIKNSVRPLVELDSLPYLDLDIFEEKRLYRPMQGKLRKMLHIELQRGCVFNCAYCCAPAIRKLYLGYGYTKYFRQKSSLRTIQEMKYLVARHNPDYINFNAESFLTIGLKELTEFSALYRKEIGLPFWCQSRPETITEKKIKILKTMNCADMQFGIEQGNEEFRSKVLMRDCRNKDIEKGIKIVEKYKIPYTVNNIIGFPQETRKLIFDTIFLNRKLNSKSINCSMFTPYRGTVLRAYCVQRGYLLKDALTKQTLDGADFRYPAAFKKELKGLQRVFNLYCRFSKAKFPLIRKAESFNKAGNAVFKQLSKLYYKRFFT